MVLYGYNPTENYYVKYVKRNVTQQGHEIYAKVKGTAQITAIVLDKSPSTYPAILAVKIDDSDWVRYTIDPGMTSVQIATGLDLDEHWVRIMASMKTDGRFDNKESRSFTNASIESCM
ncbi:hypothetical protein [Clostridium pasteurianum]|uniref:Uncharacterized protein n=1 Tax=Clostridium pasteurianum BC1 TaxID=86416 RepID=R4JYH2_CLOPA|nr:hypothetical protein [Clostridium pasteurianum]AGK95877.1 hypothetical protein Clopa_0853 [Clostridium pasteurianum BC1]